LTDLLNQDPQIRQLALRSFSGFLAFGFGSGLSRYAPGTIGTLAAVPLAIPLSGLSPPIFWVFWTSAFLLGIYWCDVCDRSLGVHDHGGVVWDEMVAYWLVLAFVPLHWTWWLAAFVLFRFFDIVKPWPIRFFDQKISGGFGIMLDDILAAAYSLALLVPATRWLGP
jgi:phosphatidylglycerophosphatase A